MISNIYFQVISLVYMLLLSVIYFSKKKLNTIENKILSTLIILNIIGLVLDMWSTFIASVDVSNSILNPISKFYLIYLILNCILFTVYVIFISKVKEETDFAIKMKIYKRSLLVTGIIMIIASIIVFYVPLYNFSENGVIYTHGPAADFTYIIVGICFVVWVIGLFINIKNIRHKKYYPIFTFIFLAILIVVLQKSHPEYLLVTSMNCFVAYMLFFTIENPDMKMIKELNIAKEAADNANSAKTDFLSNMSHEIRTPLNAISGFSQSLLEQKDVPEDIRTDIKDIMTASDSLLEIVNGVLDISKIEANKMEIVNGEYHFKTIFDELVALTKGRIGDKALDFRYKYDDSVPKVLYGDHVRVKQVILNVLTNAVKYTKKGHVELKVSSFIKDNVCRLIVSVEDTGIGIPKDKIDKLFNKFERVDLENNVSIEGTGLGLAITKRLIELMKGQIVVQSIYGQGSKFTVALNQRIITNPTKLVEEEVTEEETFDGAGKKVLVVDDNKVNLKVAKRLLESYNVDVTIAESGFECIDIINKGEIFDLILLDDMMPKMTGTETLKRLDLNENFSIPTVALTANALTGMREKYIKEGFDDYIPKPIERTELTRVIKKYLDKKI